MFHQSFAKICSSKVTFIIYSKNLYLKVCDFEMSMFMFLFDEVVSVVRVQVLNINLATAGLQFILLSTK